MMTQDEMIATLEIQQLLFRYCRGVDRGDADMIRSVYHAGARDSHGAYDGSGEGFADWLVPRMDAVPIVGQHHITNMLIDVAGDEAGGESYFIAYQPDIMEDTGQPALAIAGGRYLDRFSRRDGAWKIVDRQVIFDFSFAPQAREVWRAHATFPTGGRREGDPSFGFFDTPPGNRKAELND
jgi:SnoaL-like domain